MTALKDIAERAPSFVNICFLHRAFQLVFTITPGEIKVVYLFGVVFERVTVINTSTDTCTLAKVIRKLNTCWQKITTGLSFRAAAVESILLNWIERSSHVSASQHVTEIITSNRKLHAERIIKPTKGVFSTSGHYTRNALPHQVCFTFIETRKCYRFRSLQIT